MTDGRVLGGRYELGDLLGYGGMAEVFRGRDMRLGRDVAVKVLRTDLARDPSFQARFRREAQSAASLNHPSIVSVFDTGEEDKDGSHVPYIVMEYVQGRTLRQLLQQDGRLEPNEALRITRATCQALEYSHRAGIVHRDVKPGNVMITPEGDVKVMDFGIARAVSASQATMTQTSSVIGTAQYISPEQARGEHVDQRSDVYSTGCLLYELLTGVPPFTGDSPVAVAYQHVRENPAVPSSIDPDIPPALDAIVLKAMAKNPVNRYQSAGEFAADLDRALGGRAVQATPVMPADTTTMIRPVSSTVVLSDPAERKRRQRMAYGGLAAAVVLVFLIAAIAAKSFFGGSGDTVPIPNVVGQTVDKAREILKSKHLLMDVTEAFSVKPKNIVVDQSPFEGILGRTGGTVTVTVSKGQEVVAVPSILGLSLDDATAQLTAAKLSVGAITHQDVNKKAGTVLAVSPGVGAKLAAGSKVNLVVASGKVDVPSVIGQDVNAAIATLQGAGFVVQQKTESSTETPNSVIKQDPAGGQADQGSTVTITIATAPDSSPSPTPSSEPSPSPSAVAFP